jgi:uncharacterized protein (TIGR03067 family)
MGKMSEGFGLGCGFAIGRAFCGLITCALVFGAIAWMGMQSAQDSSSVVKADDSKKDEANLQGEWQLVGLELEGKLATPPMKGPGLTVTGNQMSHAIPGATFKGSFKLDAGKKPKSIDLTDSEKGKKFLGIYLLEGDILKICRSVAVGDRPTDFSRGKAVVIMTLVRLRE